MGQDKIMRWTKEDIIEQIEKLAGSYTPEWKFDRLNPDAGTALAFLFADMFYGTVERYQRIPQKLHRDFFVRAGQKMLPSVPAEGYVTFGLSTREFGGSYIPKGTSVTAFGEDGEEAVYETAETLYVTPAELSSLIYIDGQEDYIEKKEWDRPFYPFFPEKENLQEHALYLRQNDLLRAAGRAEIRLKLECPEADGEPDFLLDNEEISVAYSAEEGFEEFDIRRKEHGCLALRAREGAGAAAETGLFGRMGYWIRILAKKPWLREPFCIEDVRIWAKRENIEPDWIQNGAGEQKNDNILPFGERPAPFEECYFASEEALSKTGAKIWLTFYLDFEKVPFDNHIPVEPKRKIIMKRADFLPDPEYDITIEQVVWEYYNGAGWSRLSLGEESQRIFNGQSFGAKKKIELEFLCPRDAALLEWQCAPTRYLRVRALRVNNLFRLKGAYITPVVHDVRFHYTYTGEGVRPDDVIARNRMSLLECPAGRLERKGPPFQAFYGPAQKYRRLCLGFDRMPGEGMIKLFFQMREETEEELPRLSFEYFGKWGFSPLTVFDKTNGLQKSGCVTFSGRKDFSKTRICGESAYWIRITDERDLYRGRKKTQKNPKVERIYLNTVRVRALESHLPELFGIQDGEKNKVCRLLHGNIYDLSVSVREGEDWVKWEEVESFEESEETDRHYVLDRNQGLVFFSDGKNGAIPPCGVGETIRITYRAGGGERANQPSGAVSGIGSAIGFVNRVTNPLPICGGCDRETVSQAVRRGEETMRHALRAVTAGDYEALAQEASGLVQSVKCYGGYNSQGKYEPGQITLVVLWKNFREGGMYFEKVRRDIIRYLADRMEGNLAARRALNVVKPDFLYIDCYVKAVAVSPDCIFEVQEEIKKRLNDFLDPVTGNYHKKGWDIGTVPNEKQILNALGGLEGVCFIRELRTAGVRGRQLRFALAVGGRHTVVVEAKADEGEVR